MFLGSGVDLQDNEFFISVRQFNRSVGITIGALDFAIKESGVKCIDNIRGNVDVSFASSAGIASSTADTERLSLSEIRQIVSESNADDGVIALDTSGILAANFSIPLNETLQTQVDYTLLYSASERNTGD